jgi:hypothetical protein
MEGDPIIARKPTANTAEGGAEDQDSFYTMYNKEIKVNQNQIPIILAELTDAAYNFTVRE